MDRRRVGSRAGLAIGLVGINVVLAALNLDKHDVLPFDLGTSAVWTNDTTVPVDEAAASATTLVETDPSVGVTPSSMVTEDTALGAGEQGAAVEDWPNGPPPPSEAPVPRVANIEPDGSIRITGTVPDWGTLVAIENRAAARMPGGLTQVINLLNYHPDSSTDAGSGDVVFRQEALFDIGSSALRENAFQRLDLVTNLLRDNPTLLAVIIGHTDDTGTDEANLELGLQRAQAMQTYMVQAGVAPRQIVLATAGEDLPAAPNDSLANREANRRIELRIKNFFSATGL